MNILDPNGFRKTQNNAKYAEAGQSEIDSPGGQTGTLSRRWTDGDCGMFLLSGAQIKAISQTWSIQMRWIFGADSEEELE